MLGKIFALLLIVVPCSLFAQHTSDSAFISSDSVSSKTSKPIPYKQIIAPAALMSYGIIALENHALLNTNHEINEELHEHTPDKITIDNFTQYLPTASVHLLPLMGVQPRNNFRFRATSSIIANLIMGSTVRIIKATGNVWRPDMSNTHSFPSGHTATAFVGAEQVWQEYAEESIWYPISAYAIASGTGFLRMHNNKHWFSDVAMGAGIGILSTKIAYWITPLVVKDHASKHKHNYSFIALPNYDGKHLGFSSQIQFN